MAIEMQDEVRVTPPVKSTRRGMLGFYLAAGAVLALLIGGWFGRTPLKIHYWIWKMGSESPGPSRRYTWEYRNSDLPVCEPMQNLKRIGRPAIPYLIAALESPSERRSAIARDTLLYMTDAPAVRLRSTGRGELLWDRQAIVEDCRAWWQNNSGNLVWNAEHCKFVTGTRARSRE